MKSADEIICAEQERLKEAILSKDNPFFKNMLKQIEEHGYFTAGTADEESQEAPFDMVVHFQTELDNRGILHDHTCFELAYVYRGSCRNLRPGYEVILQEGDLLLMNPRAVHCISVNNPENVVLNFLIPTRVMKQYFSIHSENPLSDFFMDYLYSTHTGSDFLIINTENDPYLHQLAERLLSEHYEKLPGYKLFLQSGLQQLFVLMARYIGHSLQEFPMNNTSRLVRDVILYISEHTAAVTLEKLAEVFSYSEKHISRQMKKELGMSFTEYLQQQRLKNAAELLSHTNMPVNQISQEIGYQNVHFFYDLFQTRYGMTPAAWRSKHQGKTL